MIEKPLISSFRTIVRAYSRATGYSLSKISKELYGNARFLDRLFAGQQSVSIAKLDEMLIKITATWPPDHPWPIVPVIALRKPGRG